MRLAVFGGTGFVGRHVCEQASRMGHSVYMVGRNPQGLTADSKGLIECVEADVFEPQSYRQVLEKSDAVVHSIGSVLTASEYKRILSAPATPCSLSNLLGLVVAGRNPLDVQMRRQNYESAVVLATETAKIHKAADRKFPLVYVSAQAWNPLADPHYIEYKRAAEEYIASQTNLRPVFVRPGFVQPELPRRPTWPTVRDAVGAAVGVRDLVFPEPVSIGVKTLARAIVEAAADQQIVGVVSNAALREFEKLSGTSAQPKAEYM